MLLYFCYFIFIYSWIRLNKPEKVKKVEHLFSTFPMPVVQESKLKNPFFKLCFFIYPTLPSTFNHCLLFLSLTTNSTLSLSLLAPSNRRSGQSTDLLIQHFSSLPFQQTQPFSPTFLLVLFSGLILCYLLASFHSKNHIMSVSNSNPWFFCLFVFPLQYASFFPLALLKLIVLAVVSEVSCSYECMHTGGERVLRRQKERSNSGVWELGVREWSADHTVLRVR